MTDGHATMLTPSLMKDKRKILKSGFRLASWNCIIWPCSGNSPTAAP